MSDMGERCQYEECYGFLMRDPSYETAVVDRIQHIWFTTGPKTAPAFSPGPCGNESALRSEPRKGCRHGSNPMISDRVLNYETVSGAADQYRLCECCT